MAVFYPSEVVCSRQAEPEPEPEPERERERERALEPMSANDEMETRLCVCERLVAPQRRRFSLLGSVAGCSLSMMCIKRGYKVFIKGL